MYLINKVSILLFSIAFVFACKTKQPVTTTVVEKKVPSYVPESTPYQPSNPRLNDLLHTRLEVSFDWEKQYLYGLADLTLTPYFYPQKELILNAKGFDVDYVKLIQDTVEVELTFAYDSLLLSIALDKEYVKGEKFEIQIKYTAKPNELKAGGSAAINEDKGLYFVNPLGEEDSPKQVWTQGETEASSCWFPTIDSPNEKTTQEIYITVDSSFVTLSNGSLVYSTENADGSRTDYWRQDKQHAPYLFMMAVGEFAVVKDKWKDKEVNYYVEPAYEKHARAIFGNTPEMLEFFSERLGYEYPWDKYSQIIVREFVSGAMENTSASVFMDAVQVTSRELIDDDWEYIIAHELFHHWFGDLVTCESWSNLPLNESFANYSEYLWFEHKFGVDRADFHADNEMQEYLNEARNKQVPLIRYHFADKEDMFDRHSYNKGGRILHMLRNYLGDDAFFTGLNKYLTDNQFQPAEVHHLRLAFEEVSGLDLNWFFDQWFLSPGHPVLSVKKEVVNDTLKLTVVQLQDTLYSPVYTLPTQVSVVIEGQRELFDLKIEKVKEEFEIPLSGEPDLVLFDPDQVILGEVSQQQELGEYVVQYSMEKKYLSRYNAVLGLSSNPYKDQTKKYNPVLDSTEIYNTIYSALSDDFWNIRALALLGLSRYNGDRYNDLQAKVEEMVLEDESSKVRAKAIEFLAGKDSVYQFVELFHESLKDSSYLVNATAIKSILENDTLDSRVSKVVGEYKESSNGKIINALADYYNSSNDSAQSEWFVKSLGVVKKRDKINFVKQLADYYPLVDTVSQQVIIDLLFVEGTEGKTIYDKFSGYMGLYYLDNEEGIREKRQKLIELENNDMLLRTYKRREKSIVK